jgi:hypothetical protein
VKLLPSTTAVAITVGCHGMPRTGYEAGIHEDRDGDRPAEQLDQRALAVIWVGLPVPPGFRDPSPSGRPTTSRRPRGDGGHGHATGGCAYASSRRASSSGSGRFTSRPQREQPAPLPQPPLQRRLTEPVAEDRVARSPHRPRRPSSTPVSTSAWSCRPGAMRGNRGLSDGEYRPRAGRCRRTGCRVARGALR